MAYVVTFWGTPRGRIDVLWNTTSSAVSYRHPAYLPEATLVTQEGFVSVVPASEGRFAISLAPATANTGVDGAILVGGPPVLLIQNDTTSPTSALRPLPDPHYGAAVGLRWDVSDPGGTGYWYAEVERANASDGPWNLVAGLGQTRGTTAYTDTVPLAGRWYYRTRVRDNAGNWEDWPASAETQTTVWVTRTVTLSVTTFLDVNANGNWDADETAPTTPVIVWRDGAGDTVAARRRLRGLDRTPSPKANTAYLCVCLTTSLLHKRFQVAAGPDPTTFALQLGLRPVIGQIHASPLRRDASVLSPFSSECSSCAWQRDLETLQNVRKTSVAFACDSQRITWRVRLQRACPDLHSREHGPRSSPGQERRNGMKGLHGCRQLFLAS